MSRPKRNIVEYAAILTQGDFALGAAIEIIKNRLRHPVPSDGAEVIDADNSWRRDSPRRSRHGKVIVRNDEAGGYPTTCRNRQETKFSRRQSCHRGSLSESASGDNCDNFERAMRLAFMDQNRVIPSFKKQVNAYAPALEILDGEGGNSLRQIGIIEHDALAFCLDGNAETRLQN